MTEYTCADHINAFSFFFFVAGLLAGVLWGSVIERKKPKDADHG